MKVKKAKGNDWFYYRISETYTYHGFDNTRNKLIGYRYQDNKKGFWLENYKF
jgi:hypothetical protein